MLLLVEITGFYLIWFKSWLKLKRLNGIVCNSKLFRHTEG